MRQVAAMDDQILVKSHVARDLLQSAGLFKTDRAVVWEYVANGLQYTDPGRNALVRVTLDSKNKRILVEDNGRGMDWHGLQNFFVMHGENIDRKEGRPGRGLFGTGKSAAFGIADVLRITTVRSGKCSSVELCRSDVMTMRSEGPVPVRTVVREAPTTQANGTTIEIEDIHLKSLDQAGIIHYIERHLAQWPKGATVFVNNHECEFAEPPVAEIRRIHPEGNAAAVLGDALLVIKVAKAPLDEDLRGVSIYSNGVWHETTLAGSEGREMSQYIFGEIEVPRLDLDRSPISPFDVSRSMRLNPNNEVVRAIHAFIGQQIEEVRRGLLEAERRRRASEEARKLAQQAAEIASVINEDFQSFRERVAKAKAKARGGFDHYAATPGDSGGQSDLLFGSEVPAEVAAPAADPGSSRTSGGGGTQPPDANPQVIPGAPDAENRGQPAKVEELAKKPRGGFEVRFKEMGEDEFRAKYEKDERTIYINLDHPQLTAAKGVGGIDDTVFRRLAYEVAFSEYAIALASELAARDEYYEYFEPIVDIRETLNRVARRGAHLYAQ